MARQKGYYECDFCNDKSQTGNYYTATGNHVACQDLEALRTRLAECERVAEDLYLALGKSIVTIDGLSARASYVKYKSSHKE